MTASRCASCDAPLTGPYCAACGERRIEPGDYSLRRVFGDNLSDVANVDSKLLRSLRALIAEPGRLTREYVAGRRVRFVRPLQLFLIANLVYFVIQPMTGYGGYNTPLSLQIRGQVYSVPADLEGRVTRRAEELSMPFETYARLFNAKSEIYAKSLILLMVPLFALALALLQAGRRRTFVEHVVFATHYYAWELLIVSSLFLLIYGEFVWPALSATLPRGFWRTFLAEMATVPLIILYLTFAFRRSYANSWAGAAGRALLCIPAFLLSIYIYRFILFWVTFATV